MAALEEIQQKMGPDAVVVSVRQIPSGPLWQAWRGPGVEVVAMPAALSGAHLKQAAAEPKIEGLPAAPGPKQVHPKPAMPYVPKPLQASPPAVKSTPTQAVNLTPALESLKNHLVAQGVNAGLVQKFVATCLDTLNPKSLQDPDRLREFLSHQLAAHLRQFQGAGRHNERVICLIGPNGSGKTSTCAKLAAYHSQKLDRKVAWVCADTVSAGAISQARIFTDTLRLPLYKTYTSQELAAAVGDTLDADLTLVDTPSCNPYKETSVIELGELITALKPRATYLVVSANSKDEDLSKALNTFRPF